MRMRKKKRSPPPSSLKPLALQIEGRPGTAEGRELSSRRELQIVESTSAIFEKLPFKLPRGWSVVERPRLNCPSHPGRVDKYFIEPETGLRFRSRIAAERYLKEKKDIYDENCSLGTFLKHLTDAKKIKTTPKAPKPGNCSSKKHLSENEEVNVSMLDSPRRPAKVKWVLGGPGGNIWNPLIDEALVSESAKQEWSEKFVFAIHERY